MSAFEAFGSLLRMALDSTDDKQSIQQLLTHFQSLEKLATVERRQFPLTHWENDDPPTK